MNRCACLPLATTLLGLVLVGCSSPQHDGLVILTEAYFNGEREPSFDTTTYVARNVTKSIGSDGQVEVRDFAAGLIMFYCASDGVYYAGTPAEWRSAATRRIRRRLGTNYPDHLPDMHYDIVSARVPCSDTIASFTVEKVTITVNGVLAEELWVSTNLTFAPLIDSSAMVAFSQVADPPTPGSYQATEEYKLVYPRSMICLKSIYHFPDFNTNRTSDVRVSTNMNIVTTVQMQTIPDDTFDIPIGLQPVSWDGFCSVVYEGSVSNKTRGGDVQ